LKQLDLFTGKVARYRFAVLFYVPNKGDLPPVKVEIGENDQAKAIAAAKTKIGIKYYEQATAILLPPTEGSS
jgi:hypothetical protein